MSSNLITNTVVGRRLKRYKERTEGADGDERHLGGMISHWPVGAEGLRIGRMMRRRVFVWLGCVAPAMVVWGLYCAVVAWGQRIHGAGWLLDSDCYLWPPRAVAIAVWGQYPLSAELAGNDNLPLVILLFGASLPVAPLFSSWGESVHFCAYWISPILFLATLGLLSDAARALGGLRAAILAPLAAASMASITGWYLPGRGDHHSVIHLCFAGLFWGMLMRRKGGNQPHMASVAFAALGVWTSVEGAPAAVAAGGLYAWDYLFSKPEALEGAWRRWVGYLVLLASALGCAYLVEHGCDWGAAWASDSLSLRFVATVVAVGAGALAWLACVGHGGPARRALGIALALMAGAAAFLLWPRSGDPAVTDEYHFAWRLLYAFVSDARGMAAHEQPLWLMAVYWLGLPFFIVLACGWGWVRRGRGGFWDRLWLVLTMLAYAALSLLHLRWAQYAATIAALGFAAMIGPRLARGRLRGRGEAASAVRVQCLILSMILSFAPRMIWPLCAQRQPWRIEPSAAEPVLEELGRAWVADRRARGIAENGVLTHMMLGTAVAYRWGAEVLATPYMRDAADIITAFRLFDSAEVPAATREAVAMGFAYALVLTTPEIPEFLEYRRMAGDHPPLAGTFLNALAGPNPPGVVVAEVPVPADPRVRARLLRIEPQ